MQKKILYSLLNSSTHSFCSFVPPHPLLLRQYDTCQCVADFDASKIAKKTVCYEKDKIRVYTKVTCEGAKIKYSLFTDKACAVAGKKNTPPIGENPLLFPGSDGKCNINEDMKTQSDIYKGCPAATTAAPKSASTALSVATLAAAAVGIVAALLM